MDPHPALWIVRMRVEREALGKVLMRISIRIQGQVLLGVGLKPALLQIDRESLFTSRTSELPLDRVPQLMPHYAPQRPTIGLEHSWKDRSSTCTQVRREIDLPLVEFPDCMDRGGGMEVDSLHPKVLGFETENTFKIGEARKDFSLPALNDLRFKVPRDKEGDPNLIFEGAHTRFAKTFAQSVA